MSRILMVVANPATSLTVGWPIGFRLSELAHTYWELSKAGHEITVASSNGGSIVADGCSDPENAASSVPDDFVSVGFAHCAVTSDASSGRPVQPLRIEDEAAKVSNATFVARPAYRSLAIADGDLITGQQGTSGAAAAVLVNAVLALANQTKDKS